MQKEEKKKKCEKIVSHLHTNLSRQQIANNFLLLTFRFQSHYFLFFKAK